ncbi:carbon starvation CstA family protein [Nigerium massiliense]|uniref:carbon starvation CstA family protein n=1 Tax=Nigerium massiliense TaxID=1522317 RepID=UPI00058E3D76|nr:carbon starvation CstA family protein [Nigerium massiliense]
MSTATEPSRSLTRTPEGIPPVAADPENVERHQRLTPPKIALWVAVALLGAVSWSIIAIVRGETINGIWFVFAAVCSYLIGYRFYARYITARLTRPDDRRATPAEYQYDGHDFVPTDRRILFGHHFAAIAGAGPLVGPVLAAQMGYLPGTIWIIVGVILAGAVQDYLVLFVSMRRGGRSIGQIAKDELGRFGGTAALIATIVILLIIIAILALVVVNALGESVWGVFSVGMTIPIALFMGLYLRFLRPGKVAEVSLIGVVLLLAAIIGGGQVAATEWGQEFLHLSRFSIGWAIIIYGFVAAVLPVWLLLAPRDYLSTFMKVGTIAMLAVAIIVVRPEINVPPLTQWAFRSDGPVFTGGLFPFLFVTIACGALSGFHATIASGTTPKLVEKERQTPLLGYGGMLMESFVAIMAFVAALSVDQGIYYAMNSAPAATHNTVEGAVAFVNSLGLTGVHLQPEQLTETARLVGETSIVSRTGGAPTLAIGLSTIMHQWFGGPAMMGFWYHFAIMFEALFILTSVDAGTRVARFMLADALGNVYPKFRHADWKLGSYITTALMVAGWGSILLLGITDPLGGINTFFPLFGVANQLLASLALAVCLLVFARRGHRWSLLIVAVPMVFAAVVTIYGSFLKIFSPDPKVGYWANNRRYSAALDQGLTELAGVKGVPQMEAVVRNTAVQTGLSVVFLVCALIVIVMCVWQSIVALRDGGGKNTEDPAQQSRTFAPAGMIPTPEEKELEQRWASYYEEHPGEDLEHRAKAHA